MRGSRDFESWNTTEILANLAKGSLRVAVDGREIVRYTDKDPARLTSGPIFVETDPTEDRLYTVRPP